MTETSGSGLSDAEYWLLIGVGVVALTLVTLNIVTALGNAGLREEVRQRQQYINPQATAPIPDPAPDPDPDPAQK